MDNFVDRQDYHFYSNLFAAFLRDSMKTRGRPLRFLSVLCTHCIVLFIYCYYGTFLSYTTPFARWGIYLLYICLCFPLQFDRIYRSMTAPPACRACARLPAACLLLLLPAALRACISSFAVHARAPCAAVQALFCRMNICSSPGISSMVLQDRVPYRRTSSFIFEYDICISSTLGARPRRRPASTSVHAMMYASIARTWGGWRLWRHGNNALWSAWRPPVPSVDRSMA